MTGGHHVFAIFDQACPLRNAAASTDSMIEAARYSEQRQHMCVHPEGTPASLQDKGLDFAAVIRRATGARRFLSARFNPGLRHFEQQGLIGRVYCLLRNTQAVGRSLLVLFKGQ